ncbi:MAG: VOC family protein [Melioribacter sp.]|nr:VOC family protein [Melioribacter sp.]
MSDKNKDIGSIGWVDLTTNNAEELKKFYSEVAGWKYENVPMGDYNDFNMLSPSTGAPVAGICNKRGGNSEIPSQWMIYILVDEIEEKIKRCKDLGGKVLLDIKDVDGYGKYCVIQDPANAVCALFEKK